MVFFSNLSTSLSLGYARAEERGRPSSDEFLISLEILKLAEPIGSLDEPSGSPR